MGAFVKMGDGTGRKTLADLAQETAQLVICAMALAEAAGFDLETEIEDEWWRAGNREWPRAAVPAGPHAATSEPASTWWVSHPPQPHYCGDEFHQGDALEMLADLDWLAGFDAIHASPPCQAYSVAAQSQRNLGKEYPDLLAQTRVNYLRDRFAVGH